MARYSDKAISVITWMEVLVGAEADVESRTRAFLDSFKVLPIDNEIAERAVTLCRKHTIKLPDAIWASADFHSMLLVTRNPKDFPQAMPGVRIPYSL